MASMRPGMNFQGICTCMIRITRGGLPATAIPYQRPVYSPTQCRKLLTPLVRVYAPQFLDGGTFVFEGGGIFLM